MELGKGRGEGEACTLEHILDTETQVYAIAKLDVQHHVSSHVWERFPRNRWDAAFPTVATDRSYSLILTPEVRVKGVAHEIANALQGGTSGDTELFVVNMRRFPLSRR